MSETRICPHKRFCDGVYNVTGCNGENWYECPMFDKIEDHLAEARDMARDHPIKDDMEIPFFDDDYDGPEEDEP